MQKKWWKEAIAYQIYPRSFMDSNGDGIGDIQGIILKLDYLKDLGIDVIWVCPMFESPNDDNGYDISDYKEIMAEFGTMKDFDELLKEVHKRGMKLILDLVINHTSDDHPWFIESRSSKDSPKRDWYIWRDGKNGEEPNNWESIFGNSAWEYDQTTDQYYLHLFSKRQPDLNWENAEVRKALYEMVNWWLDKGIDGFRVDAISHIKKEEGLPDMPNPNDQKYVRSFDKHMNVEGIQLFLQELKEETFAKYDIMTVGEANGVTVRDIEDWVHEEGGKFNMVFQFEHLELWNAKSKTGLDIQGYKEIMTRWQKVLEGKGWNALFIENHDKARIVSTWGNDKEYWRESATAFAAVYFLMQGTPFIYQGQEIGMTNVQYDSIDDYNDIRTKNMYRLGTAAGIHHDEMMEIIWASSRDNSRTPMHWSAGENGGFTTGTPWIKVNENYKNINVESQLLDENSILHFYKKMIQMKKKNDVFTYGTYQLLLEEDTRVYAYTRTLNEEKAIVIANLTDRPVPVRKMEGITFHYKHLMLNNYPVPEENPPGGLILSPYETRVYKLS
ncbi:glycoside hydrolase family 13 protein [Domibacillus epiphyticus]|uniref:Alpha-amylase n=1 Tax=Domibacillus epiphyticus TaxID=1714355 RepID=A0A1V2ABM3_9BACI|nr:alpha-glucosidase [Domibacillus epiphyticus]OMP68393.1 glucohydrolase [Domibacillus epiphyticus]